MMSREETLLTDLQATLNTRKEIAVQLQLIFTPASWPQVKKLLRFYGNWRRLFSSAAIIVSLIYL